MATKITDCFGDSREWRKERYGHFLVTELDGTLLWKKGHSNISQKARLTGKVAALLEPGTLWAWGVHEDDAWNIIKERVEKLEGKADV